MPSNFYPKMSEERVDEWLAFIREFLQILAVRKKQQFNRRVSIGDLLAERIDNAAAYGFGEGTTMYDNVLVLGNVKVGQNTWIGPGCILDGSGGDLQIGDWCPISAGVQIYTHHTVNRSISLGEKPIDCAPTNIGNGVYIWSERSYSDGGDDRRQGHRRCKFIGKSGYSTRREGIWLSGANSRDARNHQGTSAAIRKQ